MGAALSPFEPGLYLATRDGQRVGAFRCEPHTRFAKADDAPPTPPPASNERWITLHPHGPDVTGIAVKVSMDPHTGHAHVINGPKELRGLKLTKLASPEELKIRAQKRAAEKKAKLKEDRAKEAPEESQKRQEEEAFKATKVKVLQTKIADAHKAALEHAQALTGDDSFSKVLDPETTNAIHAATDATRNDQDGSADGAARAGAAHLRTINGALGKLERGILSQLRDDDGLKNAVLDDSLDIENKAPRASGGRGYAYDTAGEAAQQGYTPDDAKQEAEQVWRDRVGKVRAENPERAEKMEEGRARMLNAVAAYAPAKDAAGKAVPAPQTEVDRQKLKADADKTRDFLKAARALRDLQKELRRVQLGRDPDATDEEHDALETAHKPDKGAPFDVSWSAVPDDFAADLEKRIEDAASEDLTRSFLAGMDSEPESGFDADALRTTMRGPHAAGAYAHLANTALTVLGADVMDRAVVDALGTDAAARLTAHALRRDTDPADLENVRKALGDHHDGASTHAMTQALKNAKAARLDAAGIDVPPISSTTDAAAVTRLLQLKKEHLTRAHHAFGTALGQVEAGAALNFALAGKAEDHLKVDLSGTPPARAALTLRALGLQDGDYELEQGDGGKLTATLTRAGMDRLTPQADPKEVELARRIEAIKNGAEDEQDWLPHGFTRYPASAFDANPPTPTGLATAPNLRGDLTAGLEQAIGSRLADGWNPSEVNRLVKSTDFRRDWVPPGQEAEYDAAVNAILPTYSGTESVPMKDGSGGTGVGTFERPIPTDYERVQDKHPEIHARLEGLAKQHGAGQDFASQELDDTPDTRKAVYKALLEDPATGMAFKAPADLGHPEQMALRAYYLRHIAKISPEQLRAGSDKARSAVQKYDETVPAPSKWASADQGMFSMFGDANAPAPVTLTFPGGADRDKVLGELGLTKPGLFVDNDNGSVTLTDEGKDAMRAPGENTPVQGLETLSPEWVKWGQDRHAVASRAAATHDNPMWNEFVELMHGTPRAYEAVQEHMKGALIPRFVAAHANLTGTPLRVSKVATKHGAAMLALQDHDEFEKFKATQAAKMGDLRERSGGKFADMGGKGSLADAFRVHLESKKTDEDTQGSLFGPAADEATAKPDLVPYFERPALSRPVEARLARMLDHVGKPIRPGQGSVHLIPDVTMGAGTKFAKQQRAIRALIASGEESGSGGSHASSGGSHASSGGSHASKGRLAAWLGTGSGKTNVILGSLAELRHQGKAKKGIAVVPSIVRNQFGEEAARMFEPGTMNWHAQDATHPERLKAYTDPDTHMVAVTHQSFRDDMVRLMSDHHGLEASDMTDRFMGEDLAGRKKLLSSALQAHGIPLDFMAFDEAHDMLDRSGKAESLLTAIGSTAIDLSGHAMVATGSPTKNDASEVHSWLKMLHPERFADKDEFMRRYGTDVQTSAEGLKRLIGRYSYSDVVPSGTTKSVTWGDGTKPGDSPSHHAPIPLTPHQTDALERVHEAYRAARSARKDGRVDVDSARTLNPRAFEGRPPEEHEAIASRLMSAIGTLKQSAIARVVDDAPHEHNAKIQHLLRLADDPARRGKGGVVFAHSKEAVRQIEGALTAAGHRVVTVTGEDSSESKAKKRLAWEGEQHPDGSWKREPAHDIMVCSDAGATGANLQHRGEWLAQHDLPLTQKTWEQRAARIDRLGQKRPIELHTLMSDTDHDREGQKRLERKALLGGVFQGVHQDSDDIGLGRDLRLARLGRPEEVEPGDTPEEAPDAGGPMGLFGEMPAPPPAEPQAQEPPGEDPNAGLSGLFG